jgi:hypothetical protein
LNIQPVRKRRNHAIWTALVAVSSRANCALDNPQVAFTLSELSVKS